MNSNKDNIVSHNKTVIPLNIYQCWKTKHLPPGMRQTVNSIKNTNPEFTHHLFDDVECRKFIKNECPPCFLWAYDRLIPGAYKADLWRLCVLFKRGGIYIDIKISAFNNFKLINLTDREHFVKDRPPNTIYNAFMVCKPKNPFLLGCINVLIRNVRKKYYGTTPLDPTGPGLLGKVNLIGKYNVNIDMKHCHPGIQYNGKHILKNYYKQYRTEVEKSGGPAHYDILWHQRGIYHR